MQRKYRDCTVQDTMPSDVVCKYGFLSSYRVMIQVDDLDWAAFMGLEAAKRSKASVKNMV